MNKMLEKNGATLKIKSERNLRDVWGIPKRHFRDIWEIVIAIRKKIMRNLRKIWENYGILKKTEETLKMNK